MWDWERLSIYVEVCLQECDMQDNLTIILCFGRISNVYFVLLYLINYVSFNWIFLQTLNIAFHLPIFN